MIWDITTSSEANPVWFHWARLCNSTFFWSGVMPACYCGLPQTMFISSVVLRPWMIYLTFLCCRSTKVCTGWFEKLDPLCSCVWLQLEVAAVCIRHKWTQRLFSTKSMDTAQLQQPCSAKPGRALWNLGVRVEAHYAVSTWAAQEICFSSSCYVW